MTATRAREGTPVSRLSKVASVLAVSAVAVWLGGLVALGAIAAPVVFAIVPMPTSADAMTVVFRRFDLVALACAGVVLASEAARALAGAPFGRFDHARAAASVLAAALAAFGAEVVSPRIAALHAGGAIRGVGPAGAELARLHDVAEGCGKAEVLLLFAVIVLHVALPFRVDARAPSGRVQA